MWQFFTINQWVLEASYFRQAAAELGFPLSQAELQKAVSEMDTDKRLGHPTSVAMISKESNGGFLKWGYRGTPKRMVYDGKSY